MTKKASPRKENQETKDRTPPSEVGAAELELVVPVLSTWQQGAYLPESVTVTRLSRTEGLGLKLLWQGLIARSAETNEARPVQTMPQAIKWMLHEIGAAYEAASAPGSGPGHSGGGGGGGAKGGTG